jgi:hypothetical protein
MSLYLVLTQHDPGLVDTHYCTYLVEADSYDHAQRQVEKNDNFSDSETVLTVQALEKSRSNPNVHFIIYSKEPYDINKLGVLE